MQRKNIRATRGSEIECKGWVQEAALRMLMNNLDPDVAESPEDLVVYGGTGKACRNWDSYDALVCSLKSLSDSETLLVQSGKPVGIFPSHKNAPRVLIANSNLVGNWANWDEFYKLEKQGLMMYGQMTAGSWIYIGSQGIVQGTYETFAACAKKYFQGDLSGKLIFSAGLGGMGGAQGLAATIAGAVFLGVDVDSKRIQKRLQTNYIDHISYDLDETLSLVKKYQDSKQAKSIGLVGNVADILPRLIARGIIPDIVTDQTSAHDELYGYIPNNMDYEKALDLRKNDPDLYKKYSYQAMVEHVSAMLECKKQGACVFDYGNNLREQARKGGLKESFSFNGFIPEFIRPLFCEGKGPFRWVALSGDPEDIRVTDEILLEIFPDDQQLKKWIRAAQEKIKFQGLPARICWLGYGQRKKAGIAFNRLVREGKIKAPIVIGRDHLDCGSVASPYRETEKMLDGSDAIADWPILNALINAVNGASWVSFHHGGGVGMGYSVHAGMVVVADGTVEAEDRLSRVLTSDPGMGVVRHVDAGYQLAKDFAKEHSINCADNLN